MQVVLHYTDSFFFDIVDKLYLCIDALHWYRDCGKMFWKGSRVRYRTDRVVIEQMVQGLAGELVLI